MKIFATVNKRYAKQVLDLLLSLTPKPYILLASCDDEVEVLAKTQGVEFIKIKDFGKLYTVEKLEEFDVALAALDDDILNIAIARVAKSMGIPIVIAFIHNSLNRNEMVREGVTNIIDVENFIYNSLKFILVPDTWIIFRIIPAINIVVALYKVVKRSVLGISLGVFDEAVREDEVKFFAIDKIGNFIDKRKPFEIEDIIFIIGVENKVMKAIANLEKIFRKYEQFYTMKYANHRLTGYG